MHQWLAQILNEAKTFDWSNLIAVIIFSFLFHSKHDINTVLVIKDFNFRLVLESIYTEITATKHQD